MYFIQLINHTTFLFAGDLASQTGERQIWEGEGDKISLQVKMSAYTLSWRGVCGAEFCITPGTTSVLFFPI